jgi:hypothetical protein
MAPWLAAKEQDQACAHRHARRWGTLAVQKVERKRRGTRSRSPDAVLGIGGLEVRLWESERELPQTPFVVTFRIADDSGASL